MTTRSLHKVLLILVFLGTLMTSKAADALDVWHWRSPRWTAAPLTAVSSHEGRYVAVGEQGRIVVSEDGVHWQDAESSTLGNLRAVAWGEGQWVAVGDFGDVVTSQDGLRWTRQSAGVFFHLRGVTRGNGLWVAVGDDSVILTSPDGRVWTQRATGSDPLRTVVWAGGVFVAGGGAEGVRDSNGQFTETYPALVLTSRDGLNWTQVPQRASGPVTAISHGAGRFVAVTTTGNVLISESGDSWRTVSVDAISWYQAELLAIAYDGARFVATYSPHFSALNQLWTSVDGIRWSSIGVSGLHYAYDYTGLALGPSGWVAVGALANTRFSSWLTEGSIVTSREGLDWASADNGPDEWFGYRDQLAFAGGLFFRRDASWNDYSQTEQTLFEVSSTGRQWERRRVSFDTHFSLPAFGKGRFVCVGRDGRMLVSEDANQWQPLASGVTNTLTCVVFSEPEGRFVVGGEDGTVLISSDGLDWKTLQVPTTNAVVMAATSQGRIVVGCSRNTTSLAPFVLAEALYVLSAAGVWTGPFLETPDGIQGLGVWEEGFYAVAEGRLVHSTDGTDWRVDSIIGDRAMVPTSGGGRLLIFQSGNTAFHERRAGEETWRMHELPWRVRWSGNITLAPVTGAYGHGTFLLAHGSRSLIQSEPLEPAAPQSEPAPSPAIAEGVGSTVTFEAMPRGSEPMGYQWRQDGVDIPGATSSYLTRAHSDGSGAAYTCWVTNAVGGATVGPFRVVTAEAAQLDLPPHGLGVRVQGTPGARYRLEGSVDLQSWFKLRDLELTLEGEDTAATGVESLSPSDPSRFLRARRLP